MERSSRQSVILDDRLLRERFLQEARDAGYARASLETGSMDYFAPARRMYADAGFVECGPFADYIDDPNSTYMSRAL